MNSPDAVSRLNSALQGRYRIEREIGEGGMATVYLADDLKHERKVALKVLKPELAAVVGAERFLAEIKTTANLQHPHILPLFDSGEADSFLFYVMPYVEGESLRQRIDREKQLPVDEAVQITTAVAHALQHAHDRGVIHRDIKPANILMQDGQPVVADFGIALAVGAAGGSRLTETGLSVGTPFYMSPEQATGDQQVGPPSDTYALAAVLYEMLTGDPPYIGSTAQAVLGKIIAGAPVSATQIRKSVPANVDAAIRKALEKLPADRFTGAQEFAKALGDPGFRHGELVGAGVASGVGPWKRVAVIGWSVAALATLAVGWALLRTEPPLPVERFVAPFGDGQEPTSVGNSAFNLSPDGSMLVYRGVPEGGGGQLLLVRRWEDVEPSPIRGTEGGAQPVVSPDGQEVAFAQGGEVKVVSLQGGPVRTLTTGARPQWGTDGYIYARSGNGIVRVPATGGPPEPVTERLGGEVLTVTDLLPGGDGALFTVRLLGGAWEVRALRLETGEMRALASGFLARYAESGHLLYSTPDGTLMAARFDPDAMELLGPSVALLDGVRAFSISDTGKLFYSRAGSGTSEFVWVTRSGEATPVDAGWSFNEGPGMRGFSLSPDGTQLALKEQAEAGMDIWVKQLPDGPLSRLTFDEGRDVRPRWAPNGESVTFLSERSGNMDLWSQRADGTGEPELLFDGGSVLNDGQGFWSPDGEWLVLRTGGFVGVVGGRNILALRPGVDSEPLSLLTEEYDEQAPALSPDGRWLAYVSTETGSREVFVRPFPDVDSGKTQVSTDGGIIPVWAHSGRELFYVDGSRAFVATQVETDPIFQVGAKKVLFILPPEYRTDDISHIFNITSDDQQFLMTRTYLGDAQEGADSRSPFVLVQNFFEELKARVPN